MQESPSLVVKQPTYVELLEKPELPKRPHQTPREVKQFVRGVELPEQLLSEEKKPARFASENDRSVIEETRARLIDMTANRTSLTPGARAPNTDRKKIDFRPRSSLERLQEEINRQRTGDSGDVLVGRMKEPEEDVGAAGSELKPSFGGLERGLSTFGETVPDDVKFGDFTSLNTDRHLFYSFYARMEEKIRFRWITYARAAMFNLPVDPRKATGKDQWITRLEVFLDPAGRFLRSTVQSSSGVSSLDIAPVQAFRDAGQFPNPPAEMIKSDGLIHIYYSFNVNLSPNRL